jgi:DNA-binding beta-propeller fold protein YncE
MQLLVAACVQVLSSAALAAPSTEPPPAPFKPPLELVSTTPLPNITGGDFDHFAIDVARKKLYVSAEKYGSIEVFSLPDGQHLASVRKVAVSPHKIELTHDGKELMIADAGVADVLVVNTTTFKIEKRIPLMPQPDTGIADARTGVLYIGNGGVKSGMDSGYISALSMRSDNVLDRIPVPAAQIKAMAIDPETNRLFVNFRDKNQVGVIDLTPQKLVHVWPVPGPSRNSAMAFSPANHRLFIGSRSPGKLFVLDSTDGHVIQTLGITDISDEMAVDPANNRLYVAGAGGLDVIDQDPDGRYRIEQHVDTHGGKTFAYLPQLHRLYVIHTKGPQADEAGLQIFDVR